MKVLVIGSPVLFEELRGRLGGSVEYIHVSSPEELEPGGEADVVVDFSAEESPDNLAITVERINARLIFANVVKTSLAEMSVYIGKLPSIIVGFNGLPGFINRDVWEVSSLESELPAIPDGFDINLLRVSDRVGMVTPRVLCMIINEAYYTVQEGTASREAIDMGMKLGTGYPYGPFEWADRIGIQHVYELLEVLWEDTREERYKICPLLKKEYLSTLL